MYIVGLLLLEWDKGLAGHNQLQNEILGLAFKQNPGDEVNVIFFWEFEIMATSLKNCTKTEFINCSC